MSHLNIEIKARTRRPVAIRQILEEQQARFVGLDHQIDTYFQVPDGRLKLREGNIEQALIFYRRSDQAGPKASEVHLYSGAADPALKALLTAALGMLTVVDKQRAIYFIDNVKFHVDEVQGLGAFVEIEAIDAVPTLGQAHLQQQCRHYMQLLQIEPADLVRVSYSDLLLAKDLPDQSGADSDHLFPK